MYNLIEDVSEKCSAARGLLSHRPEQLVQLANFSFPQYKIL